MRHFLVRARNFLVRDDGPTAVEYAVLLGGIFIAVLLTIQNLGTATSSSFNTTGQTLANATSQQGSGGGGASGDGSKDDN